MPFSVEAALDDHIDNLEEERLPDGMWHPSSLFGCARKALYDFRGTEKAPLDARSKRVFRMGHLIHEFIQEAVSRSDDIRFFFPEVKIIDPERGIKGHADGLGLQHDGTWVVFEFKSINANALKYAKELPKDDHRKQVASYVSVLRRFGGLWKIEGPDALSAVEALGLDTFVTGEGEKAETYAIIPPIPDLQSVTIAYLSKDNLETLEFHQVHTDAKEAWLDDYLARLRRHEQEGTLPPRLPNKLTATGNVSPTQKHYLCGYCPFAARCWNEDPEGIE